MESREVCHVRSALKNFAKAYFNLLTHTIKKKVILFHFGVNCKKARENASRARPCQPCCSSRSAGMTKCRGRCSANRNVFISCSQGHHAPPRPAPPRHATPRHAQRPDTPRLSSSPLMPTSRFVCSNPHASLSLPLSPRHSPTF